MIPTLSVVSFIQSILVGLTLIHVHYNIIVQSLRARASTVVEGQNMFIVYIHGTNPLLKLVYIYISTYLCPWELCSCKPQGVEIYLSLNKLCTHTLTYTYTVCPPLTLGNGTVSYSMEMGVERNVGSVATHTCISGYRLLMQDGGNTRTCNISGWSDQDFICGK